jgi:hypothetical protein
MDEQHMNYDNNTKTADRNIVTLICYRFIVTIKYYQVCSFFTLNQKVVNTVEWILSKVML